MKITPYGTVSADENGTEIYATRVMLWDWAHRAGSVWPCSALVDSDEITARFDRFGDLIDLDGDTTELSSDEFNAWSSDLLEEAGYPDHPAIR